MNWLIYVLKNPLTLEVRYVGSTTQGIERRLEQHIAGAQRAPRRSYCQNMLLSLHGIGLTPLIEAIESGSGEGWAAAERRWIAYYRAAGARLTNATDGGEGVVGWGTPEQRSGAAKKAIAAQTPEQLSAGRRRERPV
jgi:hypothetical protein